MKKLNKKCLDDTTCKFSEAYYQKMASKRYGIDFCCEDDIKKLSLKKELNDLTEIEDPVDQPIVCPSEPENICANLCVSFLNVCNDSYPNMISFLSEGSQDANVVTRAITVAKLLFDDDFASDVSLITDCYLGDNKCFDTIGTTYRSIQWRYWGFKLTKYDSNYVDTSGVPNASDKLIALDELFSVIETQMYALDDLYTTFYDEYDNWVINNYADSFLPVQLANTYIGYTSCQGIISSVPLSHRTSISHQYETEIIYGNNTYAQAQYANQMDYNEFFKRRTQEQEFLCSPDQGCTLPGIVFPNMFFYEGSINLNYDDGLDLNLRPDLQSAQNYNSDGEDDASLFRQYSNDYLKDMNQRFILINANIDPDVCTGFVNEYSPLKAPYVPDGSTFYFNYQASPSELYYNFPILKQQVKSIRAAAIIDYVLYYEYGIGNIPTEDTCGNSADEPPCVFMACHNGFNTYETYTSETLFPAEGSLDVIYNVEFCEPDFPPDPSVNSGTHYWNPVTKTYDYERTWFGGDAEDCNGAIRARRDAYLKALNEFSLASRPFTYSALYIPNIQVEAFKTNGKAQVTDCGNCVPLNLRFDIEDYRVSCVIGDRMVEVCCQTWDDMYYTVNQTQNAYFKALSELILAGTSGGNCSMQRVDIIRNQLDKLWSECAVNYYIAKDLFFNNMICPEYQQSGTVTIDTLYGVPYMVYAKYPSEYPDRRRYISYDINFGNPSTQFDQTLWNNFNESWNDLMCCVRQTLNLLLGFEFQSGVLRPDQMIDINDWTDEYPNLGFGIFNAYYNTQPLEIGSDLEIFIVGFRNIQTNLPPIYYKLAESDPWIEYDLSGNNGLLTLTNLQNSLTLYLTADNLDPDARVQEFPITVKV